MAKKELSVEDKLKTLYELQAVDSSIDNILMIRGELPLEVQDLEDSIEGLEMRLVKQEEALKGVHEEISNKKNGMVESQLLIKKYKEQQNNVRNNREFNAINKEIEFQELEIQLSDKRIKEEEFQIDSKKEKLELIKVEIKDKKEDLERKKKALSDIVAETETEEKKLLKQSQEASTKIEERLLTAYNRIRTNSKNGLAVVTVERESCGGCFNKIPPQLQLDINTRKKVTICEHCGRILVDGKLNPNYVEEVPVEKPKRKITRKKATKAKEKTTK